MCSSNRVTFGKNDRSVVEERVEQCRYDDSSVRIGVVGHRMDQLSSEDMAALEDRISEAMDQLHQVFLNANPENRSLAPGVVTSLAEGTDRIVARKAVELGLLEIVVLPFSRSRFERDFLSAESRREFHVLLDAATSIVEPPLDSQLADDAYESASSIIIECTDLLIAVWDGQPGRGPGGTAHSIGRALQRGVPVVWISSQSPYAIEVISPATSIAVPFVEQVLAQFEAMHGGAHSRVPMEPGSSSTLVS
ncbi:hypothetical protein BH24CHL4_BH24CHL4_04480 [soil metagenome]